MIDNEFVHSMPENVTDEETTRTDIATPTRFRNAFAAIALAPAAALGGYEVAAAANGAPQTTTNPEYHQHIDTLQPYGYDAQLNFGQEQPPKAIAAPIMEAQAESEPSKVAIPDGSDLPEGLKVGLTLLILGNIYRGYAATDNDKTYYRKNLTPKRFGQNKVIPSPLRGKVIPGSQLLMNTRNVDWQGYGLQVAGQLVLVGDMWHWW